MSGPLFGIETEYAIAGSKGTTWPHDQGVLLEALLERAHRLPHLRDPSRSGMFLTNGARFYIDCGAHPELTTPECGSPHDVVRYIQAGERMLTKLTEDDLPGDRGRMVLYRGNVDYSDSRSVWGCHESYLHHTDPRSLPAQLIPHLVSRVIYSGAGGFNNLSAGIEFTLSPRVPHLSASTSDDSTGRRGIFHTKDEPLCGGGGHRLHLICGESLYSETATFLKVGATALVLALIEAGVAPGAPVALRKPLAAMNAFAADPTCAATAALTAGGRQRAIDIQRHYLEGVAHFLGDDVMPPWAEECCALWRAVLDRLEEGPDAVAAELDWAIRLPIYKQHARRRGFPWKSLRAWNRAAAELVAAQQQAGRLRVELTAEVLEARDTATREAMARFAPLLARHGMDWKRFPDFLALRRELHEIDVRFGQLGEEGLFAQLDAAGVLRHRVEGVGDVEQAMDAPPAGGRAEVRGRWVRQLAATATEAVVCDWAGIWDQRQRRTIDLRDPFAREADWGEWVSTAASLRGSPLESRGDGFADFLELTGDYATAERVRRDVIADTERRLGGEHPDTALACNQLGVLLRTLGRPAEAEPFARRALAIDEAARGPEHQKVAHRLNNLALLLVMQDQLEEARALLGRAWEIKMQGHDITSARVVWTRLAAAMLAGEAQELLVRSMKTLLAGPQLSSIDVAPHWHVAPVVEFVRPRLAAEDANLLLRLGEVLNDRRRLSLLDALPAWAEAAPVALESGWPAAVDPTQLGLAL